MNRLEEDSALVGDLIEWAASIAQPHLEKREAVQKIIADFKLAICELASPGNPDKAGSMTVGYLAAFVGIYVSLDAIDQFQTPAVNTGLSEELRKEWAKVKNDWRASLILTSVNSFLGNIRNQQEAQGILPLDMAEPSGHG